MEFILLMDRIKCWYNIHLQVLTNAPALHSLIICQRYDAAHILKFLFRNRGYLRKLILKGCFLGGPSTDLLVDIVSSCPDLEVLSLVHYPPFESADYFLIPRLKKLSEVHISESEEDYVRVC